VGDLFATYEERTLGNTDLAPASIVSRQTALKKVRKTWPELAGMKPSQVTPGAVMRWVTRFKAEGTNFRPNGAKSEIKGNSATSVNRAIDTLRRVMDIALENGAIHTNPVAVRPSEGRLKKKVTQKRLVLPSKAQINDLYSAMENNGAVGGWGREAADFCRFLNYSGSRLGEVALVTWAKIDWDRKLVHVPGYKSESSDRIIPLFPDLETLLRNVMERRKKGGKICRGRKALP
jgi:integrase